MSWMRILPYPLLCLLVACGGRSRELIDGAAGTTARQPPVVIVAAAGQGGATGSSTGGATSESGSAGQPTGGASGEASESGQGGAGGVSPECELPVSASPCLLALCTNAGPELRPRAPRTACALPGRQGLCDGAGSCVECLTSADCGTGEVCGRHACVAAATCGDGQRDGQETSVDCGGPDCDACGDSETCRVDQDCESDLCDPLSLTCLPFTCRDGVKNGDETDVDCGGATCAGCYFAKQCTVAADCATHVCSAGSCGGSPCLDQRQDGRETDVDCGGPDCAPCLGGQKCRFNFDCADFRICARVEVNGAKVCQ